MVLVVLCWLLLGYHPTLSHCVVRRHSDRWYFSLSFDASQRSIKERLASLQNYRSCGSGVLAPPRWSHCSLWLSGSGFIGPCLGNTVRVSLNVMLVPVKMPVGHCHHSHSLGCTVFSALKQILPQNFYLVKNISCFSDYKTYPQFGRKMELCLIVRM